MLNLFQRLVKNYPALFQWILLGFTLSTWWALCAHASSDFPKQQIEAAALQFLQSQAAQYPLLNPEIKVTALPPNSQLDCPSNWEILPPKTRFQKPHWAKIHLLLRCPSSGGKKAHRVTVESHISAEVLVAHRSIPANQLLSEADWVRKRQDITHIPDAVSELTQATASRQSLHPGQIIQQRFLQASPAVQRGQWVQIQAVQIQAGHGQSIRVSASGEALENGKIGKIIRVRNTASGKIIQARVISAHEVTPQ